MTGVFLRLICKAQYFHSYSLKNNLSIQLIVVLMQLVHLLLSFRDIFSTVHALIDQKSHVLFKKQKNMCFGKTRLRLVFPQIHSISRSPKLPLMFL